MGKASREQTVIDAPIETVWDLIGDPNRHPEWWPMVLDVECSNLEEGCSYRSVQKRPFGGEEEHELTVEKLDGCREILIRCEDVGVYTRFILTEAQGATFVEAEFGAEAKTVGMKVIGALAGRRYLKHWIGQTFDGLREAAAKQPPAS
ncbi:MAG: SRPBCC family protein [Thermoleophilaceae bacterium]